MLKILVASKGSRLLYRISTIQAGRYKPPLVPGEVGIARIRIEHLSLSANALFDGDGGEYFDTASIWSDESTCSEETTTEGGYGETNTTLGPGELGETENSIRTESTNCQPRDMPADEPFMDPSQEARADGYLGKGSTEEIWWIILRVLIPTVESIDDHTLKQLYSPCQFPFLGPRLWQLTGSFRLP